MGSPHDTNGADRIEEDERRASVTPGFRTRTKRRLTPRGSGEEPGDREGSDAPEYYPSHSLTSCRGPELHWLIVVSGRAHAFEHEGSMSRERNFMFE